jgi:hypothetical protein
MHYLRQITLAALLAAGLGCQAIDSELRRGPNGEPSALERQVGALAPAGGPYGTIAVLGATLITSIFAAFHAREANKQTDTPPKA